MSKEITQPTIADEKELNGIIERTEESVKLGKRTITIGALRNGVARKIADIILTEKDESKVSAKCVAAILCKRCFRLKLFWWVVWRWIYYWAEYPESELTEVIMTAKKKLPVEAYYINTILLTEMRDTMMAMTREEVNLIRQGQTGVKSPTSGQSSRG